jgi:2-polyprenyl-3-methyl-5-hydroxy-6-metoxy-1,4-benzoquinol methylase
VIRTVRDHYAEHLGPLYSWMVGGVAAATARGTAELDALGVSPKQDAIALDLGAGIGMHAIPLAQRGYSVIAVDTDAALLNELTAHANNLPVKAVAADLLEFRAHLPAAPDLILCMGDTLTHLPRPECVIALITDVASALSRDGVFVCTFRDYTRELRAEDRFILVKSTSERILTCFLEYSDRVITVHDILHEREHSQWRLRVSSYQKIRLAPRWIRTVLEQCGFEAVESITASGMVQLTARLQRTPLSTGATPLPDPADC